jgi:methylamine--corrinoid protein Co-methyltransferase
MVEQDFDMSLFRQAEKMRKELNIVYDPESPVPHDDGLADRLFHAGFTLFISQGTYCVSTGRVVRFSEKEIKQALANVPREVIFGSGKDAVTVQHREVEGKQGPIVCAGVQTALFSSDDMALRIYEGCAREKYVDGLWGGVVDTLGNGYSIVAGAPTEVIAYRRSAEVMRKAVAAAGRPGMMIVNNAPKSAATIAMYDPENGLRVSDGCDCAGTSEMKIGYDDLNRVAFAVASNTPLRAWHNSVIGGFSGSVEGAAIVCVAGAFQSLMVCKGNVIGAGTVHYRTKSKCTRECIWVGSVAMQALSRNTQLPLCGSIGDHPAAGPGTKQYLYESAAGFIANAVSGGHHLAGTRKFVIGGTYNYGTPLESRWMGEITKVGATLKRSKANDIVKFLLSKYENKLADAPHGYVYEQLYNAETGEPNQAYLDEYSEVWEELSLEGLGEM